LGRVIAIEPDFFLNPFLAFWAGSRGSGTRLHLLDGVAALTYALDLTSLLPLLEVEATMEADGPVYYSAPHG
jgi:hypothetical protein